MPKVDLLELEPVGSHETNPFAAQDKDEIEYKNWRWHPPPIFEVCIWTRDPNDFEYEGYVWSSGCNRVFEFMDNRTPGQIGFRSCPFCGAYLVGRIVGVQEDGDGD